MMEMDSRSGEIPAEVMGVSAPDGVGGVSAPDGVGGEGEDRRNPVRKEMLAIG